jgi:hypothetical protein
MYPSAGHHNIQAVSAGNPAQHRRRPEAATGRRLRMRGATRAAVEDLLQEAQRPRRPVQVGCEDAGHAACDARFTPMRHVTGDTWTCSCNAAMERLMERCCQRRPITCVRGQQLSHMVPHAISAIRSSKSCLAQALSSCIVHNG